MFEMRAEWEFPEEEATHPKSGRRIRYWHMVRDGRAQGLCGRDLDPQAPTQSETYWGQTGDIPFCHTCGALYLRQVP